jgi:hypothetical protein
LIVEIYAPPPDFFHAETELVTDVAQISVSFIGGERTDAADIRR